MVPRMHVGWPNQWRLGDGSLKSMKINKSALLGLAAACIALALVGCRDTEQSRPLSYKKGTYQGPMDQKLKKQDNRGLNNRIRGQRFI